MRSNRNYLNMFCISLYSDLTINYVLLPSMSRILLSSKERWSISYIGRKSKTNY